MSKVILISGCSQGLGKFLAEELATKGYTVYAGVRSAADIKRLEQENPQTNLTFIKLDVTDAADCIRAVEIIRQKENRLDVLINNAGNTVSGPISEYSDKEFLQLLDVNTVGAFRLITAVIPAMKGKGGKIINITSLNGMLALPNFSIYSSSKFALQALGNALYYELAKDRIQLTSLAPGAIKHPEGKGRTLPHKGAREKFQLLKILMPFVTYEAIVGKIVDIITSKKSSREVILGNDAKITIFLQRFLPNIVWESLMLFVWKK